MQPHFFISDSDGALYDTRADNWSMRPPLRPVYQQTFSRIGNTQELKATLRAGGFAWPGGYPLYFIASDGAAVSFEAVREHLRWVVWSIRNHADDGWRIVGCAINYEDDELTCEHTNKRIPSAYGESE